MPDSASRPVHRRNRQGPPRRALLTSSLAGALLLPMLTVPPAYAAPSGTPDIPADPADWASAPYSPLAPESLDAGGGRDGAVELTFDGKGAGLPAADGRGTGFTAVLPSSEASPYFVPERLLLSEGKLKIAAGNGSAARGRNDLDNALGVPLAAQEDTLRLSTVLAGPVDFAAAAEGGIWFGASDRNFVTLSLAGSGSEARQVKLTKETGDAFRSPADGATESKDQVIAAARQSEPAEPVRLTLDIDPSDRSVAGSYQIGDGKAVALGPLRLPAGFLDGTEPAGSAVQDRTGFGGVYASAPEAAGAGGVEFAFDSFSAGPQPVKEKAEAPVKEKVEAPAKEKAEEPAKEKAEAPAKEKAEAPAKEKAEAPAKEKTEEPAKEKAEAPAKEKAEAPAGEPKAEAPAEDPEADAPLPVPAAPKGVAGTATGQGTVLHWKTARDAVSYNVYRAGTRDVDVDGTPLNGASALAALTFTDTTARPGSTYYYKVVALNRDGKPSRPSKAAKVLLPAAAACRPGEWSAEYFAGTALSGSPVAKDCTAVIKQEYAAGKGPAAVGADDYSIRWTRTINGGAGSYVFSVRADDGVRIRVDGTTVLDEWKVQSRDDARTVEVDLADGPHEVVVEYFQEGGEAFAEIGYQQQGGDGEAPAAPADLAAKAVPAPRAGDGKGAKEDKAGTAGAIELTWSGSESPDAASYRVYRGPSDASAGDLEPLAGAESLDGTEFVDSTAEPEAAYSYGVTALDAAGNESPLSLTTTAMVGAAALDASAAPSGLAATAGDGSVTLTWTASAGADIAGYRVYRSLQPVVPETGELYSGATPLTGTTFTDTAATNGTTYFYVVTAVDLAGAESPPSNEAWAVPNPPNTTLVKVDFTATGGTPATGYAADWGQAFGPRSDANQGSGLSYGWKTLDGNPLSLVGNGRDRGRAGIDERLDSVLHMQYGDDPGTNGIKTEGQWELAVPDGLYEVTVAAGDMRHASGYDSLHAINVEAGVGIETFQSTDGQQYLAKTVTVGVWDGALTITAAGGRNTKIAYIDVVGKPRAPHVDTMRPDNRTTGHDPADGVSATIRVPYAGVGVDAATLPGNVHIYETATGAEVPSSTGTSGGNDVISTQPDAPLKPNTSYRFEVTAGVKDNFGASFVPFTSVFTTGAGVTETPAEATPLTGISFDKVEQPEAAGYYWSSMAFGPDGKLYASSIGQGISRFTVAEDGSLTAREDLGYEGRAIIGLVFDKSATADDLKVWITSTSANTFNETGEWVSGVSLLTGASLENEARIFEHLPRSQADHLTNSMAYGPDGRLYFLQGSNQAAGDLDNSWGQRGEQLLTAAVLVFDPDHSAVRQAAATGVPIDVKTAQGGTYDPYQPGAPLQIHATGIRNAYDLVWHSNGHLYVPTNGTAGGANTPGVTANADGTFTRTAASGIPGYSSVNGQDVTAQCLRRGYTGGSVPAIANHPTQRDLLFDVVQGGYYGHPNPTRCEWVLNEGNDPAKPPASAGQGGTKYPAGVKADPDYRGIAWDLEFNKSPNGAIEYQSEAFGGQLKGRLIVTRFSNNNDLLFLEPDADTGKILGQQTSAGITGVANSMIGGVSGFNDPLEVVEDPRTGNLYVNQYDRSGSDQKMFLLRVPADQQAANLDADADELVFSAVKQTSSAARTVTVTNTGPDPVTLSASVTGTHAGEFAISGGNGASLAPGAATTVSVTFRPGSTVGQRQAVLHLAAGDRALDVGLYGLTMNGIEGLNEPTLANVMGTLGHAIDVGWLNLEGGVQPAAKGDEVLEPLFVKSGAAPVTMVPLAQYAPREDLPFGWYTGNGTTAERHALGSIAIGGYQSLLPPVGTGTASSFDPGDQAFGLYYYSNAFQRVGYTEDRLNTGGVAHRARIYPAKDRAGRAMANSYIVAFEDASNGDYQDYVFLVTGAKPANQQADPEAIRINFSDQAAALPAGYLRDYGQGFASRTGADQGSGLEYGWKNQATETALDITANGRFRSVAAQTDQRLKTFMHMQSADVPNFSGVPAYAFWEIGLEDGLYDVTVAAGDTLFQSAPEAHTINLEGRTVIDRFTPTGSSGAATRTTTATAQVAVTDGYLTVDAIGGTNTKIDYIDIVPAGAVPGDDPTEGAQVKVNFQPATAPTPAGWSRDTGLPYSAQAGSGWLVNGTPTDRTGATRYRQTPTQGINYPAGDPLLQTYIHMGPAPGFSSGTWEYDLPNGTYTVAVSAGDPAYLDSTHGIAAEGQPLIASFVPTGATPFQTGYRDVNVTDGKLTLSSTGTNTKINWVSIKGSGLDQVPDSTPAAKYNFQPAEAATPAGWTADSGGAFDADGYGWLVGGLPADRLGAANRTRAMNGITYPAGNPLLQTLMHMQAGPTAGVVDGVWERALANGTYEVSLSVGDANYLDSTHSIAVEGQELFEPFVPTTTEPFKTGTATVEVADGRLTLAPTGTNTKINWVTIKGANLNDPVITVDVNGVRVDSGYSGGSATVSLAAKAAGSASIEALTYAVDDGTPADYSEPFTLDGTGTHTVQVRAEDSQGRSSTRTVTVEVQNVSGTLQLRSGQASRGADGAPVPGFAEDWLVMHRINSDPAAHPVVDQAALTLSNSGTGDLRVSDLPLRGTNAADFTLVDPPQLPLVLAPGETATVTVKFTAASGTRGVRSAQLDIVSSDPQSQVATVQLRGGYMAAAEDANELSLEQIVRSFGWTTNVGTPGPGSAAADAPLDGEEVRSALWHRADMSRPVTVRQLAAMHGPGRETINIAGQTVSHAGTYNQTYLPPDPSLAGPAQLQASPDGAFPIVIGSTTTQNTSYRAVKAWPVRDRAGNLVPDAWIVANDIMGSASACLNGTSNCDYQDNVYLVTNMVPGDGPQDPPPASGPVRINAGGGAVTANGVAWAADSMFTGGKTFTNPAVTAIAGTEADEVYLSERSGAAFGYDIPLASGEYSVRLHFAEIWHGTQSWAPGGEGKRAFGVNLEGGTPEIESLDLGAAAGTATAHTVTLPVTVSDGNLDIDLFSIIDEATIAGIEVLPAGTETPPEEQAETVRINAGAGAVTAGGLDWQADGFFTGGKTFTNSALTQIAGTEADEVYRSERSGSSFGYRLPLAPGEYTVRLHFAEIWHGTQSWAPGGAGRRVFDVNLEGGAVELDGLDLGAVAGTASAYVATEVVAVTDGSLDIDFTAIVDQATVSAIEIVPN